MRLLVALLLLLGSLALFSTTRLVTSMLYSISAYDPLTLACVTGTLLIVTTLAALSPALRAAALDPIEALRTE